FACIRRNTEVPAGHLECPSRPDRLLWPSGRGTFQEEASDPPHYQRATAQPVFEASVPPFALQPPRAPVRYCCGTWPSRRRPGPRQRRSRAMCLFYSKPMVFSLFVSDEMTVLSRKNTSPLPLSSSSLPSSSCWFSSEM